MNDEPVVGSAYLPNTRLDEGSYKTWICLDEEEYFTDIEDDTLHYKAVVDPDADDGPAAPFAPAASSASRSRHRT